MSAFRACLMLAIAAATVLGACSSEPSDPEAEIRALIATAGERAEERDVGGLIKLVDESYSDGQGNDKRALNGLLRFYFVRNQSVFVLTRINEIAFVQPHEANVHLVAALAGRPIKGAADLLPLRAELSRFELFVRRDNSGDWRVVSAYRARATPQDFF